MTTNSTFLDRSFGDADLEYLQSKFLGAGGDEAPRKACLKCERLLNRHNRGIFCSRCEEGMLDERRRRESKEAEEDGYAEPTRVERLRGFMMFLRADKGRGVRSGISPTAPKKTRTRTIPARASEKKETKDANEDQG